MLVYKKSLSRGGWLVLRTSSILAHHILLCKSLTKIPARAMLCEGSAVGTATT